MTTGPLNGKTGELLRWLLGLALAALISYFTAIGSLREQAAVTNGTIATERALNQARFDEVQRSLVRIERFMERIEATGADAKTGEPYRIQGQQRR